MTETPRELIDAPNPKMDMTGDIAKNAVYPEEKKSIGYVKSDNQMSDYSVLSSSQFFYKHSYRDIGRRKFHFCLSFCSVFIVVWSALVINTLVEKGPIIFLKLAEGL